MASAKEQMSKILDQLMGDDKNREKKFTDKDVCRPFLVGICINELFVNTRVELCDCPKIHSLALKAEFEKASEKRDYHFEEEVMDFLKSFLLDNERKIESAKKRLDATEETPEMEAKAQQIHELAVQIGEQVAKAEALGAEGKVDESLAVMSEVENVKFKKKTLEDEYHTLIPRHAAQQQKLRACEVCGAFLSMYDNDRRLADHFGGKLHIGFVTIRDKIKSLEEVIAKKEEKRQKEREEYQRDVQRGREREKRRSRSPERRKSRSRSRDRQRRRERERERDRDRNNGRDRRRSREGDSGRRERRDRSGEQSRHRSRSRERRRSRSGSR